jgi:hypothetical protein
VDTSTEASQPRSFNNGVAGTCDFGGIPNRDPILQKGYNFKVDRESKRYLAEELTGGASAGKPKVKFVRELVQ